MRLLIVHGGSRGSLPTPHGLDEAEHVVTHSSTAEDAIDVAYAGRFDAIVVLPLVGTAAPQALCRRLRERGIDTPVLVLVARSTAAQRVAALEAGADDCVSDPVDPSELLARLNALARRRRG